MFFFLFQTSSYCSTSHLSENLQGSKVKSLHTVILDTFQVKLQTSERQLLVIKSLNDAQKLKRQEAVLWTSVLCTEKDLKSLKITS